MAFTAKPSRININDMKAVLNYSYGSPDVLQVGEAEKPVPKTGEVLVKVRAVSINPLDWRCLKGSPYLVRLKLGLSKPKTSILGADIAGEVDELGSNVKGLKVGDKVFTDLSVSRLGGFAEYVCVPESDLAKMPSNLDFEGSAALPVAALTALQGLRDSGNLKEGQEVLINGASGGIGTFAIQIAKSFGAEVTAVCSGHNHELVKSIGADHIIDYTKEDFSRSGNTYDLILDNVGNRSMKDLKRVLKPGGICAMVGFSTASKMFGLMLGEMRESITGGPKLKIVSAKLNVKDLEFIANLVESGKLRPVIDQNPQGLVEIPDALRYSLTGRARGKIVVSL